MCNVAKLDAFVDKWPGSEYGPAHIVLDDANIEDSHIDWCIGLCRQWLGQEPRSENPSEINMWNSVEAWADHPKEEIEATLAFLIEYRAIPEDARLESGDKLCGEEPIP